MAVPGGIGVDENVGDVSGEGERKDAGDEEKDADETGHDVLRVEGKRKGKAHGAGKGSKRFYIRGGGRGGKLGRGLLRLRASTYKPRRQGKTGAIRNVNTRFRFRVYIHYIEFIEFHRMSYGSLMAEGGLNEE